MKQIIGVVLLILATVLPAASADRLLGPEQLTSVDELAYEIGTYFPKVQGDVTAVQDGRITIALGRKDGLIPGMVLTLWRDGREILHPVTKAVIGRAEDEVGTVEVVSVGESSSVAALKSRMLEPRAGDRARITPKKISLAVLPVGGERPEMVQTLADRLGELGRFTVLSNAQVAAYLKENKRRDSALIKDLGKAYSLDAVVAVGIYPTEGKYLVTSKIYYTDDTKPLDTIVALLNLSTKREALGEIRPFFAPVKESEKKAEDLPVQARYFCVADLEGGKVPEYVFSDGKQLSVYRKDGPAWKAVWIETVPAEDRGMQQFHLDVADINGNGTPEIFVTRMLNGTVSSYVVEFRDGAFKRIAEVPAFLRVIDVPGRGQALIGQGYSAADFYSGPVREYAWSGGAYTPGAELPLPAGVDLYGFVYAEVGEARPLLVSFDSDEQLVAYSGDTPVWKSEQRYLTVPTVLMRPRTGIDAAIGRSPTDLDRTSGTAAAAMQQGREVKVPGRIVSADLYGTGTSELVVAKNTPVSLLGGYKGGELEVLSWTGARLDTKWNVRDLSGPVLDIHVVRNGQGAAQIAALVRVSGGLFRKDRVRIETYRGQ